MVLWIHIVVQLVQIAIRHRLVYTQLEEVVEILSKGPLCIWWVPMPWFPWMANLHKGASMYFDPVILNRQQVGLYTIWWVGLG